MTKNNIELRANIESDLINDDFNNANIFDVDKTIIDYRGYSIELIKDKKEKKEDEDLCSKKGEE